MIQAWVDLHLLAELLALVELRTESAHEFSVALNSRCWFSTLLYRPTTARPLEPAPQPFGQRGAQIDLGHLIVPHQLGNGTADANLTLIHNVRPIDDLQGLFNIVVRNDDADSPFLEGGYDVLDVVNRNRVDARERLVEKHEFGLLPLEPA